MFRHSVHGHLIVNFQKPTAEAEDIAKEPVALPPHLQLTLLNVPLSEMHPGGAGSSSRADWKTSSATSAGEASAAKASAHGGALAGCGEDATGVLPRPAHVILNHVYIDKASSVRGVLVLGTTHRYKSKYVTQLHYKPTVNL